MDDTIVNEQADLIPGPSPAGSGDEPVATAVEAPASPAQLGNAASDNGQPARAFETEATPPVNGADATTEGASLMEQFLSDPSHDYKTLKYGDVMDGVIAHI